MNRRSLTAVLVTVAALLLATSGPATAGPLRATEVVDSRTDLWSWSPLDHRRFVGREVFSLRYRVERGKFKAVVASRDLTAKNTGKHTNTLVYLRTGGGREFFLERTTDPMFPGLGITYHSEETATWIGGYCPTGSVTHDLAKEQVRFVLPLTCLGNWGDPIPAQIRAQARAEGTDVYQGIIRMLATDETRWGPAIALR